MFFSFFSSVKREIIEMFVIKDGEGVGLSEYGGYADTFTCRKPSPVQRLGWGTGVVRLLRVSFSRVGRHLHVSRSL